MTEQTDAMGLSEAERIEVNRRIDVAHAAMEAAALVFAEIAGHDKAIAANEKITDKYGLVFIGVALIAWAVSYFTLGRVHDFFSGIGFLSSGWYFWFIYWAFYSDRQRYRLNERLRNIELAWVGAMGYRSEPWYGSFGGIRNFSSADGLTQNEAYHVWWLQQQASIRQNVCDANR